MGATRAHRGITGKETDMVGWIILAFFIGAFVGIIIMVLCVASRAPEQHIVHVFVDDDGIKTIKAHEGDLILFHKTEDASSAP